MSFTMTTSSKCWIHKCCDSHHKCNTLNNTWRIQSVTDGWDH